MPAPIVRVTAVSTGKISSVPGQDTCQVRFLCDQPLAVWEARANGHSGRGVGLLVGEGGTLPAGEEGAFEVSAQELTWGDKTYCVSVYGQSSSGVWSDCIPLCDQSGVPLADSAGAPLLCVRASSSPLPAYLCSFSAQSIASVLSGL